MLILNANEVRQALPMAAAIGAMREAFAALTQGTAQVPARIALDPSGGGATPSVSAFFGQRSNAVERVAIDFAETVVSSILEAF